MCDYVCTYVCSFFSMQLSTNDIIQYWFNYNDSCVYLHVYYAYLLFELYIHIDTHRPPHTYMYTHICMCIVLNVY